eukprot:scaffold12030_cov146-Isochrysis_galbana.AAC.1
MAGLQRSGPQNGALVPLRPTRRHGLRQARARHPIANRPRPHRLRLRTYRANNNKNSPKRPRPGRTRKRYTLAATLWDTPCLTTLLLSLPFPIPIISPSLFLIQAALAGGWFKSCVHYNSLRLGLENLGENVEPSYVRVHLDFLRADYG